MCKFAILDAVRLIRVGAEAAVPVDFVVGEVSFEPDHLGVAFDGQDAEEETGARSQIRRILAVAVI